MENRTVLTQFTHVLGNVSNVRNDLGSRVISITVAGQKLLLHRGVDDGMKELGLLRLTKRKKRVFLIYWFDDLALVDRLVAGWKDPDIRVVNSLVAFIAGKPDTQMLEDQIHRYRAQYRPTWQSWSNDVFVTVSD